MRRPPRRLGRLARDAGLLTPPSIRRALRLGRLLVEAAIARRLLRRRTARARRLADAIELAYTFRVGTTTLRPTQVRSEIGELLELLAQERPRTVLEIGTYRGATLYLFARAAADDAVLVSVDLDGGPGGALGRLAPLAIVARGFAGPRQRVVTLLRRDAHDPETLAEVERTLEGRAVDFLFIDGDHSDAGVRSDFDAYGRLVRPGGLVGFHDIVPGDDAGADAVPAFWREISPAYESVEIVESWEQGGLGIGLVRVPPARRPDVSGDSPR